MRMQKPLIILGVTASVLVGAYLVYDHFRPGCGEIFEQTALNVRAKTEIIQTKGEIFIGREKIQELTSSSQKVGQHLKTCCTVLQSGNVNPDQFQRCIESAQGYEANLTKVVTSLDQAHIAKQQDQPDLVKAKVDQLNTDLNAAKTSSKELEKQVADITKPGSQEGKAGSAVTPTGSEEKRWEIIPNPKLKSLGRIVVSFPENHGAPVGIFRAGGKEQVSSHHTAAAFDLLPGQYDVKIHGATVASVPVQRGMDTRMRTGVVNIITNSGWELYDETKTTRVLSHHTGTHVGLPIGRYHLKVGGGLVEVAIKDGQVTDF